GLHGRDCSKTPIPSHAVAHSDPTRQQRAAGYAGAQDRSQDPRDDAGRRMAELHVDLAIDRLGRRPQGTCATRLSREGRQDRTQARAGHPRPGLSLPSTLLSVGAAGMRTRVIASEARQSTIRTPRTPDRFGTHAPRKLRDSSGIALEKTYVPSSLNLLSTSSVIATIAASASGPSAETIIVVPGAAASIISPMIERPPTVSLPRVTQTSEMKRSTVWTNFAEARACSPRLLMIRSSLETAPPGTLGPGIFSAGASSSVICRRGPGWRW